MPRPTLGDLLDAIVVIRDAHGQGARHLIDHVDGDTIICTDVFRGRRPPRTRWAAGEEVQLGAPTERGWLVATGHVERATDAGSVTVVIGSFEVVQRRQAYREEIVVPLLVREHLTDQGRRGRTDNLSIGGFAARLAGHPIEDGTDVLVTFSMPERDELTLACRKVAGDLQQRFEFVDLDRPTEERLARLVRATELARRRAERIED